MNGKTVVQRYLTACRDYPDLPVQIYRNKKEVCTVSYSQSLTSVASVAAGLKSLGFETGSKVTVYSDNRPEWLIFNFALLGIGGADVPRGTDTSFEELNYIIGHSESRWAVFETKNLAEKFFEAFPENPLQGVILFSGNEKAESVTVPQYLFSELLEKGNSFCSDPILFYGEEVSKVGSDDLACIIYTSGTTGRPKGVMLPHRSFIFQLDRIYTDFIPCRAGHKDLCVLPIWHAFERTCEYIVATCGAALIYGKPIGPAILRDLAEFRPQWFGSVPRIWEGVYKGIYKNVKEGGFVKQAMFGLFVSVSTEFKRFQHILKGEYAWLKRPNRFADILISFFPLICLAPFHYLGDCLVFSAIRKKLGGAMIACVSGGGSLPPYIDRFFMAAGITLLEGYGLTETGPVLAVRKLNHQIPGVVGEFLPDIEYKVVDESGRALPPGTKGRLLVKSPQVMDGYYKDPEKTEAVLKEGWFDTEDLVIVTYNKALKIIGRAKETIVLSGGENVEPKPIEDALSESPYIESVMLVGQDRRYLGALIVPAFDMLNDFAREHGFNEVPVEDLANVPEVNDLYARLIREQISPAKGFRSCELIGGFVLLTQPFRIGVEMTTTLKIRRNVVAEMYASEINSIYNEKTV